MEETEAKKTKSAFVEFIHEAIGYESGMFKTVKDLRSKPNVVVSSYLEGEKFYTSPFKILMTITTAWLFFSNLIIDWYSFWQRAFDLIIGLEFKYLIGKAVPTTQSFLNFKKIYIQVGGDVFSKLYIFIVIIGVPLCAYFCFLFSKKFNIPFRTNFAIVSYSASLNFITSFLLIGVLALNIYVGLILMLAFFFARIFGWIWFYNLILITPVPKFFDPPNSKFEKIYTRSMFVSLICILALFTAGYAIYFAIRPI